MQNTISIALKFDRDLSSTAADAPAKFQSDATGKHQITNIVASRLYEILC